MKKRQSITLLEIMIVIFLIGLIGGVVGYNMKGSLDRGRAFKTQQMQEKIAEILELEMNIRKESGKDIALKAEGILNASGFFKNNTEVLKDGWGEKMDVDWNETDSKFNVTSKRLQKHDETRAVPAQQNVKTASS